MADTGIFGRLAKVAIVAFVLLAAPMAEPAAAQDREITSPYWLNEKRLRDSKIALIGEKIAQAARSRKRPA